jgi:hypothetical protein
METISAYQELESILTEHRASIDEVDVIDPMIIQYYTEVSDETISYMSSNLILIQGKLGISKDSLPSLF